MGKTRSVPIKNFFLFTRIVTQLVFRIIWFVTNGEAGTVPVGKFSGIADNITVVSVSFCSIDARQVAGVGASTV